MEKDTKLTGEQWYNLFIKQLMKQNWMGNKESRSYFAKDVVRAAKEAAGISDLDDK